MVNKTWLGLITHLRNMVSVTEKGIEKRLVNGWTESDLIGMRKTLAKWKNWMELAESLKSAANGPGNG